LILPLNPDPNGVDRALKLEQQALALDDSLAIAHSTLGEIYMRVGQDDLALNEAKRAVALDPNSAPGYTGLAQVLNELGRPKEALAATEKAMRLDPRFVENYLGWQGWAYTQLGRWQEAISSLKPSIALYPGGTWSHVLLAEDYAAIGNKDSAQAEVTEVERMVALEPNSALGYLYLADALNGTGRPVEALAANEKAKRLDPRERDFYLAEQGWADSQLGRWQVAITPLKRLPSYGPVVHVWLAVDYIELGHDDAARAEIREVLKIDPEYSLKTGVAQFLSDQERAAADLRKAGLN
jgi:tetratricopeptide (TPR) repeat protein